MLIGGAGAKVDVESGRCRYGWLEPKGCSGVMGGLTSGEYWRKGMLDGPGCAIGLLGSWATPGYEVEGVRVGWRSVSLPFSLPLRL